MNIYQAAVGASTQSLSNSRINFIKRDATGKIIKLISGNGSLDATGNDSPYETDWYSFSMEDLLGMDWNFWWNGSITNEKWFQDMDNTDNKLDIKDKMIYYKGHNIYDVISEAEVKGITDIRIYRESVGKVIRIAKRRDMGGSCPIYTILSLEDLTATDWKIDGIEETPVEKPKYKFTNNGVNGYVGMNKSDLSFGKHYHVGKVTVRDGSCVYTHPMKLLGVWRPNYSKFCRAYPNQNKLHDNVGDKIVGTDAVRVGDVIAAENLIFENYKNTSQYKKNPATEKVGDGDVIVNASENAIVKNDGCDFIGSSVVVTVAKNSKAFSGGLHSIAVAAEEFSEAEDNGLWNSAAVTIKNYSMAHTNGNRSISAASGDFSEAYVSGDSSIAVTSGIGSISVADRIDGVAVANGHNSKAVCDGDGSVAIVNKFHAVAENYNKNDGIALANGLGSGASVNSGIAIGTGVNARVMANEIGSYLVAVEYYPWNAKLNKYNIKSVVVGRVNGTSIKPGFWYEAVNGKLVQVLEDAMDDAYFANGKSDFDKNLISSEQSRINEIIH